MKKICFVFNHLQFSDGVARAAIGISNYLAEHENVQVTLRPLFYYEKGINTTISDKVVVKPLFGFYFKGLAKILEVLPSQILHWMIFRGTYDIEVGFQYGVSIKALSDIPKKGVIRYAWIHGYDEKLKYLKYYQKVDKVICVSKCNSERLYKESNKTVISDYCYNLIDDNKIRQLGARAVEEEPNRNRVTFVTVGRLSPEKGYGRLLECVARLKDDYSLGLWIIGDGPERDELIKEANLLNINDNVVFLGAKENPHEYTSKADVFVCSSFSEGYSTACTEAIILGIPVITTNVSGAEEIIEQANAGLITEIDTDSLLAGMKHILDNPSIINDWKKILEKTKYNFSLETRKRKIDSLFLQ